MNKNAIPSGPIAPGARRLARRRRADARFKFYCQMMIMIAIAFVFLVLGLIAAKSYSAFSRYYLDVTIQAPSLDPGDVSQNVLSTDRLNAVIARIEADLSRAVDPNMVDTSSPELANDIIARLSVIFAVKTAFKTLEAVPSSLNLRIPIEHELDLYLKNRHVARRWQQIELDVTLLPVGDSEYSVVFSDAQAAHLVTYNSGGETSEALLNIDESWFELRDRNEGSFRLVHLAGPKPATEISRSVVNLLTIPVVSTDRKLSNRQIALAELFVDKGLIKAHFNRELFTNADSTLPEIAGAAAAMIGTILTLLITSLIALPIGVLAAIYLEELAPSNRLTNMLEININNLAAIPSIIFGLLGAAVLLNTFGMPRSVPLVGGLVLGFLVLPTVIISARAALIAVPYDLRAGALALGASRMQTVFDHVLPAAGPGIMTGAILAMARAIGETAPLLLIGMVAFIHEIPRRIDDEATVLPVLIYKWFSSAERAWDPMTAAVVLILVGLLICLNLLAVIIRWQMDKTWARQ